MLDLKVDRDQIRVFTHTLAPVRLADGRAVYGCTEFVFPLGPDVKSRGDVATVTAEIDRVLRPVTNG